MSTTFIVKIGEEEKEDIIRDKTFEYEQAAREVYNQTFNRCLKSGGILRQSLDKIMKEQGIWNEEKQSELTSLQMEMFENEKILDKGGIKLSEAKDIALKLRELRANIILLSAERNSMDSQTVEGQADQARFNVILVRTAVYNTTKKPVFANLDEYLNKSNEEWAFEIAQKLASVEYNYDEDFDKKLPENEFLLKYKFVNEDLALVNKDGEPVDLEGNVIEKEEEVVFQPFLDDDGNPIE